ncbi:MAG: hypothetical protein JWQ71_1674 [Pedosphaera sp.]|nr:hypothetical protein [Pedosphaera sp.]
MKISSALRFRFFTALLTLTMTCGFAVADGTDVSSLHAVRFELGDVQFAPGDSITIQQVSGTSDTIAVGGTYSVDGTYTLVSQDEADLALHATVNSAMRTAIDSKQHVHIKKGTGSFHLVKTLQEDGYLHVSFYPVPSGSAFGGLYFGQGNRVLHHKGFSHPDHTATGSSSEKPESGSGPNQALLAYLGEPVQPPANMDAKYTKKGLLDAIQLAARNAGITTKKVVIDDSEYPFLVGVICKDSDSAKLKDQLKKLEGYEYNGSVGSDTCNAFSLVPYKAHPQEAAQSIDHRLLLRQQVFLNKLITGQ